MEIIKLLSLAKVGVVAYIFFSLLGLVLAMGSLLVTFIMPVDVNSTEWRRKVANEVYDKAQENRNEILKNNTERSQKNVRRKRRRLRKCNAANRKM